MDAIIEQKAKAFSSLADQPWVLILFVFSLLCFMGLILLIALAVKKPEWIKDWFKKSKSIFETDDVPENEKRHNKQSENDRNANIINEICNDCVKSSVQAIQVSVDAISETLKLMNVQIERATINAGLAATGGDLALTDWLRIVFDLWRKGVNGNTVDATKIKIMKENGIKTWNSELSHNKYKYGEGDKHFRNCVKKIEDGLR